MLFRPLLAFAISAALFDGSDAMVLGSLKKPLGMPSIGQKTTVSDYMIKDVLCVAAFQHLRMYRPARVHHVYARAFVPSSDSQVPFASHSALQASSSLEDAAQLLVDKSIRGAPVVNADGKLVGVLSQFDFLYKAAGRKSPGKGEGARSERFVQNVQRLNKIEGTTVSEVMTGTPITVTPDTTMQDAAALLLDKKLGRLLVVDDAEQLVGLLSCTDMMSLVLSGDLEIY